MAQTPFGQVVGANITDTTSARPVIEYRTYNPAEEQDPVGDSTIPAWGQQPQVESVAEELIDLVSEGELVLPDPRWSLRATYLDDGVDGGIIVVGVGFSF